MPPVVAKVAFCASCWRHWKPTNTIAPSTSQTVANLIVLGRSSLMGAPSACGRSRRAGWSFRFGAAVRERSSARDLLVDRAEDRCAGGVLHLDPDRVAEAHEGRLRRAALDRLDRALL